MWLGMSALFLSVLSWIKLLISRISREIEYTVVEHRYSSRRSGDQELVK